MATKWMDIFIGSLKSAGVNCDIANRVNGWIETAIISGNTCYTKSVTFNSDKSQYFQGVDPSKLREHGDYVIVCGGFNNQLKDIFIIPWKDFFSTK
jgi:flagellar basal body rod protein FlgF